MPGEFEREVGFYAGVDFALAAVINAPAAVGKLALQDMARAAALQRLVHFAEPMHEEHEVGAKRAIDHQFADPMPVGLLLTEQVGLRERDRLGQLLVSR